MRVVPHEGGPEPSRWARRPHTLADDHDDNDQEGPGGPTRHLRLVTMASRWPAPLHATVRAGRAAALLLGRLPSSRLAPSPARRVAAGPERSSRPTTVYLCPTCDARFLGEQRCPDCNTFARRLGPGGSCPHCDDRLPSAISSSTEPEVARSPADPTLGAMERSARCARLPRRCSPGLLQKGGTTRPHGRPDRIVRPRHHLGLSMASDGDFFLALDSGHPAAQGAHRPPHRRCPWHRPPDQLLPDDPSSCEIRRATN